MYNVIIMSAEETQPHCVDPVNDKLSNDGSQFDTLYYSVSKL